ncbi:Uncharacterised protein [uncultured archaeon]|nr:Uncharacterised protein [uncultured archaeon]
MKKVVKGFFLFLILLVGVSYTISAVSQCADGRHGVEIDGSCYYCGNTDDGVCPSFYGAPCSPEQITQDSDCGSQESGIAYWYSFYDENLDGVVITEKDVQFDSGQEIIYEVVESTDIHTDDSITFKVKRTGVLGDTLVTSSVSTATEDGWAYAEWIVDKYAFSSGGGNVGDSADFYFQATKQGLDIQSDNLKLTIVSGETCTQVQTCNDYTDEITCGAVEDSDGNINLNGDFCNKFYTEANIEEPPGCFGIEYYFCLWNGTGCNLRDLFVPNDVTATCTERNCDYIESGIEGSCDSQETVTVTYNPIGGVSTNCPVKNRTYTCPSLVALPFFTTLNLVIAVIVIAGIYFYSVSRKKKRR